MVTKITKPKRKEDAQPEMDLEMGESQGSQSDRQLQDEQTPLDRIYCALAAVSQGATIRIHRQTGAYHDSQPLLDVVDADGFDEDSLVRMIKRRWGGGKFRLYFRDPESTGNVRNVALELEGKPKVEDQDDKQVETQKVAQSTAADIAAAVSAAMAPLLDVVRQAVSRPTQEDQEERVIEKLLKYRSFFGENSKADPLAEATKTIQFLQSLGMYVGPPGGEEQGEFEKVVDKLSPAINAIVAGQHASGVGSAHVPVSNFEGVDVAPVSLAVQLMLHAARISSPVEPYADMILQYVDGEAVKAMLEQGDQAMLEQIVMTEPRAAEYQQWFMQLVAAVRKKVGDRRAAS